MEYHKNLIQIIRLKEVARRTGLARASIYRRLDPNSAQYDPTFPRPIRLSANARTKETNRGAVGFIEADIDKWLLSICQQQQRAIQ